jgi:hypothetical protein
MPGDEVVECLLYWPAHLEFVSLLCSKRITSKRYLSDIVIETNSISCVFADGDSGGWSSKFEPLHLLPCR